MTSDPIKIANVFNNYFSSNGEKAQSKIRFSNKTYTDCLCGGNLNSFLITPTEVISITVYPLSVITNLLVQTVYQQKYENYWRKIFQHI